MKMKLTIKTWVSKDKSEQRVDFDPPPANIFDTIEKDLGGRKQANCRVLWCYYREGKRVATVLIQKGDGEISWAEVNRLRRCWPTTITIRYSGEHSSNTGSLWTATGQAALYDSQANRCWRLALEPAFSDEAFIHPEDNEAFDSSPNLTQADRDWIDAKDRCLALKHEMTPTIGTVPPSPRKRSRYWSQPESYSINTVSEFAKLWCACRRSINKSPRSRIFLDEYRGKLAEMNIRNTDDIERVRNVARKAGLIERWYGRSGKTTEK